MLRYGRVSSVNREQHTAQVVFYDVDNDEGAVSYDLAVLQGFRGDVGLPVKDQLVACVLDPGSAGTGVVLGVMYSEDNQPPTDDDGARVVAGDDLRLGSKDATDKVALAPAVDGNFDAQKTHFDALYQVISGPPIAEPGNGAPSALQVALAAVLAASPYPSPDDTGAEKVAAI